MSTVIMLLLGAGLGGGVVLLILALTPAAEPMSEIFEAVERPGAGYRSGSVHQSLSPRAVLVPIGSALTFGSNDDAQLRRDLAVTGSTIDDHAIAKVVFPAALVGSVYLVWIVTQLAGVAINPLWVTLGALCLAAVGFVVPDIRLRNRAKAARIGFRHALSAYLDLVTVIMSGGGGLLTALQSAADAGDGWAFAEIRSALDRARLSNRPPWEQLGVLGERFDISELRDLVSAAELAGAEGARISESVATKSDVLRARLQSEVEQSAESLTEQMLLPVGLLLVALFLFLGFALFDQLGGSNTPVLVPEEAAVSPNATTVITIETSRIAPQSAATRIGF